MIISKQRWKRCQVTSVGQKKVISPLKDSMGCWLQDNNIAFKIYYTADLEVRRSQIAGFTVYQATLSRLQQQCGYQTSWDEQPKQENSANLIGYLDQFSSFREGHVILWTKNKKLFLICFIFCLSEVFFFFSCVLFNESTILKQILLKQNTSDFCSL